MADTLVLRLVSTRGKGSIAGFSKDPAWPGWIPFQSFSFGSQSGLATGSTEGTLKRDATEVFLSAKMSSLDVTSLHKWVIDGEPASAQINLLNPRDGKKQSALIFSDVASFSVSGDNGGFSLNFNAFKQLFFPMSFP